MAADEAAWALIELAYVESDETIPNIAKRFGVGVSTIQRRAVVGKWPRRKGRAGQTPEESGVVTVGSIEAARNDVVRRLYRRMSEKLTKLEQDASVALPEGAAADPDDRMLTALIRQFEKLTGLDGVSERERGTTRASSKRAGRDGATPPEQQTSAPLDAVRIRNEIADRLEKLHADRLRKTD